MRNLIRLVLVAAIAVVGFGAWQGTEHLKDQKVELILDEDQWTPRQQALAEERLLWYENQEADVVETSQGTFSIINGELVPGRPNWLSEDGLVQLRDVDRIRVAEQRLVQTPSWVFWVGEMQVVDFNLMIEGLVAGLILGLALGLTLGLVAGPAVGLVAGLILGLAYVVASGLLVGLLVGLLFALAYGLIYGLVFVFAKTFRGQQSVAEGGEQTA